jgi:hypothetical protein
MNEIQVGTLFPWVEVSKKKVPGSRFTKEFNKAFVNELKPDPLDLFRAMEEANLDLAGVNSTFITLIPKCDTLQQISDYRPVTLQQTSHEQFANKDDSTISGLHEICLYQRQVDYPELHNMS